MAKQFLGYHEIPYYECDTTQYLKIPTMVKMLIKISADQSESLGVSDDFMQSIGLGWIILQHDILVKRLPRVGEKIKLITEAESYNKFFCYRNFWIMDENEEECVFMETTFAVMDMANRKIGTVTNQIIDPFESMKTKRIKRAKTIEALETVHGTKEYNVRYYDIDANQHVNNAIYLEWVIDSLNADFLETYKPESISIKFNKEILYGEKVTSSYEMAGNNISRHLISSGDESNADVNIVWCKCQ